MTVLVFQVYFYTVLVVEKKTKFSTKSPRKYAIFTPKSQKKISGDGTLPLLRLLHLWGGGHPLLTPYTLGAFSASSRVALLALNLVSQLQLLDPPMISSLVGHVLGLPKHTRSCVQLDTVC